MSKLMLILNVFLFFSMVQGASGQSQETTQLLLNVEKLSAFKQILKDMKKGYQVLSTGYSAISELSQGNFSLHKTFLDGLTEVSPTVKKYRRIARIIDDQNKLLQESRLALHRLKAADAFNDQELAYLGRVYENLFKQSLQDLDDLLLMVTANKLRMSDDERMKAIDAIFFKVQDKLLFLRQFNHQTAILALQRARERSDVKAVEELIGIKR